MTVVRNFEQLYASEDDPWSIGDARSPRYSRYFDVIRPHARGRILDIGCGLGAFLARFEGTAESLDGVELSATAVAKGAKRYPSISFHEGSAAALDKIAGLSGCRFDLIICSDVVYYLTDDKKAALMDWITRHLAPGGHAFIAAWCPGKEYLTPREMRELVSRSLSIAQDEMLADSGHLMLLCRPRRRYAAITIDYETWHPIPEGKRIDWDTDVFRPMEHLLELFRSTGVAATFFAEMGEYFWLAQNEPRLARRMEEQWRGAVSQGHDVQLHLHPCWLPELGASFQDGRWHWDWSKAKADDYPGDLGALIGRCKSAIEAAVSPVAAGYTVTCFRAGAYQAQPFERLALALIENGIYCDSSVHPQGVSADRAYDYRFAHTRHQPYFADLLDPQLPAVPAEEKLIELPIFSPETGGRWFIDGTDGERLAERLASYERRRNGRFSTWRIRTTEQLQRAAERFGIPVLGERSTPVSGNLYYVAIGHTKAPLNYEALHRELLRLKTDQAVEFVTLSSMALEARSELGPGRSSESRPLQAKAVPASATMRLREMVPFDVDRILDMTGAGQYGNNPLATLYPWAQVTNLSPTSPTLAGQNFSANAFDCVYAGTKLVCVGDIAAELREIHRVLADGGCLVAAIPLDGLFPEMNRQEHAWKTTPAHITERLEKAGFRNVSIVEIGSPLANVPPLRRWLGRTALVRAWKVAENEDRLQRALRAMDWLYRRIEPTAPHLSEDPRQIITDAHGFCIAYSVALGRLLRREGYDVTWTTMLAVGHERGQGPRWEDTHEVVELKIDGEDFVLDPMSNTCFPHSLEALLRTPELADQTACRDERCKSRGYQLYNTSYWFQRVTEFTRRSGLRAYYRVWRANNPAQTFPVSRVHLN